MSAPDESVARRGLTHAVTLGLSVLLHLAVAGPTMVFAVAHYDDAVMSGERDGAAAPVGDGALGDGGTAPPVELLEPVVPVQVSMYDPPPAAPVEASPSPTKAAPLSSEAPTGGSSSTVSSEARGETDEERKARLLAEKQDELEAARGSREASGVEGKPPRGQRKPCDPLEEVTQLAPDRWRVERSIVDYYASHLKEFDQQAVTKTVRDERNKPMGIRVYLPRCSVLRSGGLKNGDIIRTVNGKKINTLPAAIRTWMAVRGKSQVEVDIVRKDGTEVVFTYQIVK